MSIVRPLFPLIAAVLVLAACDGAVSAGTPPLAREGLVLADRAAWYEALGWPEECERSFQPASEQDAGVTIYPLEERISLVEVVCLVAAYQRTQIYLTLDERVSPERSRLLEFPTYTLQPGRSWAAEQVTELMGIPEFDASTHELTLLTKFRGVGDCGSRARYGFEAGEPVLREFLGKAECDGAAHGWQRIGP
jgi:hypothetical protein